MVSHAIVDDSNFYDSHKPTPTVNLGDIAPNLSIKNIRSSIINFIIDNAELMSIEANKVVGKFFINNFGCNN